MGGLSNYFKVAESSCAFCMDHPLGNSLPDKKYFTKISRKLKTKKALSQCNANQRKHTFLKTVSSLVLSPPVKVSHLLEESMVLDEERPTGSDRHRVELVRDGGAMASGQG